MIRKFEVEVRTTFIVEISNEKLEEDYGTIPEFMEDLQEDLEYKFKSEIEGISYRSLSPKISYVDAEVQQIN